MDGNFLTLSHCMPFFKLFIQILHGKHLFKFYFTHKTPSVPALIFSFLLHFWSITWKTSSFNTGRIQRLTLLNYECLPELDQPCLSQHRECQIETKLVPLNPPKRWQYIYQLLHISICASLNLSKFIFSIILRLYKLNILPSCNKRLILTYIFWECEWWIISSPNRIGSC